MTRIDPELERLEKAEQDAQGRYLRLEGFHDAEVVKAARGLWESALGALEAYRGRKHRPESE